MVRQLWTNRGSVKVQDVDIGVAFRKNLPSKPSPIKRQCKISGFFFVTICA